MIASNFLIIISLTVIWNISTTVGIECVDCVGDINCMGKMCEGDHCMIAVYSPKIGKHGITGDETKVVKGCVTGNLLKGYMKNTCERIDEPNTQVRMCLCDDKRFCNNQIDEKNMKVEKIGLVTCKCSDCASGECIGEYCTYTTSLNGKLIIKGCSNQSLPLIERKGEGACMTPPISPSFISTGNKKEEEIAIEVLKSEVCLCAKNNCNEKHPKMTDSKRLKCKMSVYGLGYKEDLGECDGEHCFKVEIHAREMKMSYEATGCMSFMEGRKPEDELNEKGCVNFDSKVLDIKACFDTKDIVTGENRPELPPAEKSTVKPKHVKPAGKPNKAAGKDAAAVPVVRPEAGNAALKKQDKPKGIASEEDSAEESDSNTTIVVVFVVIMIIIVIAGVVWKFELHKKIFQARYQTVAG